MKSLMISILFALALPANAQFFDFGFRPDFDEMFPRQRMEREPEEKAKCKGGKEGMNEFIEKNYKNPSPKIQSLNGESLVYCVINEKGKVSETQLTRGLASAYDKEAVRVVKKMKFKPATRGKKKVKSRYQISFPIRKGRLSFNSLPTIDL